MELYKSKYFDRKRSGRNSDRNGKPFRSFRNSRDDRGSRYSRDDRRGESTTVTCADCGTECQVPFVPRTDKPVYCSDCFRQNKPQDSGNDGYSRDDRGSRYSRDDRRGESTTVTCADCGTECQVPFVPRTDKPVYCSDCFRQNKPQDSGNDGYSRDDRGSRYSRDDRGSRYSRDDRGSRYSRDDRGSRLSRDDSRPRKSINNKFLKKQESFFSDGSEKFYASLKEKLFEILGGKVCSSCGFKDEKALGFSHKFDDQIFDNIRRGGAASSWGKYISEPELAREELNVLCLNCNEIRQPMSKPKESSSKRKQKKSRHFPR